MIRLVKSLGTLAALALLGGCSSGRGLAAPTATCSDGQKNGSETAVDCGGGCGATCALGLACSGVADCLFGGCQASVCVAPTGGPAPTGPVSATIPPEGATLTAVTAEHVSVSVIFPAGAVTAPLQVTLTPQPLTGGRWFAVTIEPDGVLLEAPALVTVTLPGSVPTSVAGDGLLLFTGAADASVLATSAAGLTLTAPLRALGVPSFVDGPPSLPVAALAAAGVAGTAMVVPGGPDAAPGRTASAPLNLLIGLPMSWATRVALADNLITVLAATGRSRDALEIAGLIVSILQRASDPALEGQLRAFIDRTWTTACRGFNAARSALVTNNTAGHPACAAEASRFAAPMMNWVLLLERMEAYSTNGCANYSGSAWIDDLGRAFNTVIETEKSDILRMWRCDCNETPAKEWTPTQRGHCLTLGFPGLAARVAAVAAVAPADVPTTDLEWDHLADTVARAYQEASLLGYMGLDAPAATERALLADPHLKLARSLAFAGCRRDGSQKPVARLLVEVPGLPALRDDGQYCATALGARQTNASGGVVAQLAAGLGGVDADEKRTSGSLRAAKAGTLSLSGPIAALRCQDGSTGASEQLVVKLDGAVVRTLSTAPYLATPLDLDLAAALEAAHPGATAALKKATLTVERTGAPCAGAWGASPAPLLSLELGFAPQIAFNCPSLTSPYGTDLCTIDPDGTGQARVVVDGASPAWSHDRSRLAFSLHGALTIANSDGTGSFTVPLPAGATASSLSWSPDDTQLAFAESSQNPMTICFVGADGSGHRCLSYTLLSFNGNGYVPSNWNPRPAWSPDGARIAFVGTTYQGAGPPANFAVTYDVYVINVDGSGAVNVTMNSATVRGLNPAWSPDGTRLAYVREDGATFKDDIYVTTPGGGAGTPITSIGYADDPAWSPDGSRIAYADLSSLTVMIVDADGSSVATTLAPGSAPAW